MLVVVHTTELEVLLLERADRPGWWQSVTGARASTDEPLDATCVREVAEETGIVVGGAAVPRDALVDWQTQSRYDIFPAYRHRYAPGTMQNREHVFGLVVPRDVAVVLAPREHTACRWLPREAAALACFSQSNAAAIRRLPVVR